MKRLRWWVLGVSLLGFSGSGVFAAEPAPAKAVTPTFGSQVAAEFKPTKTVVYKTVEGRELHLDLFFPSGFSPSDRRPALLGFHGGGWTSGSPASMYAWVGWAAQQGLVGISVQYRLFKPKTETTVFECVKDARSAVRYLRAHAAELGIDPARIVVSGSSAGGHLAAATTLFSDLDEKTDDLAVSCAGDALILLWPVIDTSAKGYGHAKVGERWRELSPLHHVRPNLPPTLLFHGRKDATVPFPGAQAFHDAMLQAGNRCDFVISPDGGHGFSLDSAANYADALREIRAFLTSLGDLPKAERTADGKNE